MTDYGPLLDDNNIDEERLAAVTAQIRGYCGWHIGPSVTETITVDSRGGRIVELPTLHMTTLTAVIADGTAVTGVEWSQLGLLRQGDGTRWPDKWRGVIVTLTHGYDPVPADLAAVVRAAASRDGDGLKKIGPFEYFDLVDGFYREEIAVLNRFRIHPVVR